MKLKKVCTEITRHAKSFVKRYSVFTRINFLLISYALHSSYNTILIHTPNFIHIYLQRVSKYIREQCTKKGEKKKSIPNHPREVSYFQFPPRGLAHPSKKNTKRRASPQIRPTRRRREIERV